MKNGLLGWSVFSIHNYPEAPAVSPKHLGCVGVWRGRQGYAGGYRVRGAYIPCQGTCHRQEVTENRGPENIWLKIRAHPKLTSRILSHFLPVTSTGSSDAGGVGLLSK